jgi:hypothetical protein
MRGPSSVLRRSVGLIMLPGDPKQPVLRKWLPFEAPASPRPDCRNDLVRGHDSCGEREDIREEQPSSEESSDVCDEPDEADRDRDGDRHEHGHRKQHEKDENFGDSLEPRHLPSIGDPPDVDKAGLSATRFAGNVDLLVLDLPGV